MKINVVLTQTHKFAGEYQKNLENKNLLFVFSNKNAIDFVETVFLPKHFFHLTGLGITEHRIKSSTEFYKLALKGELTSDLVYQKQPKFVEMKMLVMPQTMNIHETARMIGDYSSNGGKLFTEKVAGNSTACLGFVLDDEIYIPNTNLKSDIRDLVSPKLLISAILRKDIQSEKYGEITYVAKKADFTKMPLTAEILDKLTDETRKTLDPTFKPIEVKTETMVAPEQEQSYELTITREIGGKFKVAAGGETKEYSLNGKAETLAQLREDWGLSQEQSEQILRQAENQNAVETELKKTDLQNPTQISQTKTESQGQLPQLQPESKRQ